MFDSIASLGAVSNLRLVFCKFDGRTFYVHWYRELHRIVLVDTPISAYFGECFRDQNLDEVNVEILRNSLYKVTYFLLKLIENYHINLGLLERFFQIVTDAWWIDCDCHEGNFISTRARYIVNAISRRSYILKLIVVQ